MTALRIDTEGRFAGYASMFGRPDQGGDIVMPGAFAKSLGQKGVTGIRMLFQHDPKEPVGLWMALSEDAVGLRVAGRLLPGVPRAEALMRLIADGALDGLSIGFRAVRATRQPGSGRRLLHQIDLWEISIVTFPMMDGARIASAAPLPGPDTRLNRSQAETLRAAISLFRNH